MAIKLENKTVKPLGNTYYMSIPRQLVICNALSPDQEYDLYIVPKGIKLIEEDLCENSNKCGDQDFISGTVGLTGMY